MAQTEMVLTIDTKDIMTRLRAEMRVVFEAGWDAMRASMKAEVGADYAKREDLLEAGWLAFEAKVFGDNAEPKAKYFIVWNADKSEGFITNDEDDAASALTGEPHMGLGYPTQSTLGEAFYENYGEEGDCPPIQEVELDLGRA